MDKNRRIRVNILICAVILVGFVAVGITGYGTYSNVIRDDIVNISKLTSTNIYAEIRNELTKPIFVSLTMANDSFVKGWLKAEAGGDTSAAHLLELQDYLVGIKQKYGYDSVFLISDATSNYYHFHGLNKVINPGNEHDLWYYSFLDRGLVYDLDIDTDEANHNRLSVFINCRIVDETGKLLGVTGVGLEIDQVQELLRSFENDFQLEAMLFNRDGIVQVHSNARNIQNENVFSMAALGDHKGEVTGNTTSLQVYQFADQNSGGYLITRYIEDLDWYLLVKKDTSVLARSLYSQLFSDLVIYVLVVVIVLLIVNRIIIQKERSLMTMARTDQLTGLPNRRGFNGQLEEIIGGQAGPGTLYVFVFDVDNFKKINDAHGHLIGDSILKLYAQVGSEVLSGKGGISRWGGDEFAGYLRCDEREAIETIELFFRRIRETPDFQAYHTTISMGVTACQRVDTTDTLIYRADQALYAAKAQGKDRYVMLGGA